MKKLLIPLTALILIAALAVFPTASDMQIYEKVIRLHVIANSDSAEDQALKLKVRDGILSTVEELTRGCKTKEEADRVLSGNSDAIKEAALRVLKENGSDLSVGVVIGQEKYPTREYGEIRLPSGKYCSVRVKIGEAGGKNWWCVLFPPLCLNSSTKQKEELLQVGFTPDQVGIITESSSPKYKVKFKILEIIGNLFS
jgi:stage II sporulation protein R